MFPFITQIAHADVINPGNNPYPNVTQNGSNADGGAGIVLIAIILFFIFKKSK